MDQIPESVVFRTREKLVDLLEGAGFLRSELLKVEYKTHFASISTKDLASWYFQTRLNMITPKDLKTRNSWLLAMGFDVTRCQDAPNEIENLVEWARARIQALPVADDSSNVFEDAVQAGLVREGIYIVPGFTNRYGRHTPSRVIPEQIVDSHFFSFPPCYRVYVLPRRFSRR
jgi:hypothetical protein